VSQRSNDYFAPTVVCNALNARQRAQRGRARVGGTPDSLQDLSGAPPDSQAGPHVRALTVRTQRPGDVAGALDSVRVIPGLQRREVGGCSFCFFPASSCCFGDLEFCEQHSQLGQ
jgi:hypothetical protein